MKYETGVSNGIIYRLGGGSPVLWPSIISVNLSFPDAKQMTLTYEGQTYHNKTLKSRCEATVKCFDFPIELYEYLGYSEVAPGFYIPGVRQEICMFSFTTQTDDGHRVHTLDRALIIQTDESFDTDTEIENPRVLTFKITTEAHGNYSDVKHLTPPPEEPIFIVPSMLVTEDGDFIVHDGGKIIV